jgi:hypothetical protein
MKKQSELVSTTIQDLLPGVIQIIDFAKSKAALFLNAETTLMYWGVGHFINTNLKENNRTKYGRQILATLSQELSWSHLLEDELKREYYMPICMQNCPTNNGLPTNCTRRWKYLKQ